MTAAEFRARSPEWSIQSSIVGLLKVIGLPHSVTDASLVFDDKGKVFGRGVLTDGWPDISAVIGKGRFLGIETKSASGALRPAQIKCHAELRNAGALVIVPRSVEEFARVLVAEGIEHQALTRFLQKPLPQRAANLREKS